MDLKTIARGDFGAMTAPEEINREEVLCPFINARVDLEALATVAPRPLSGLRARHNDGAIL